MSTANSHRIPARVEEDDLDDLDDIVEQFEEPSKSQPPPAPVPAPALKAGPSTAPADPELNEDFIKQLAEGMEMLMRELDPVKEGSSDEQRKREFEKMLVESLEAPLPPDPLLSRPSAPAKKKEGPGAPDFDEGTFQRSIQQTLAKLKDSESTLKQSAASEGSDPLESLLSQLGGGTGGEEDDEQIQNMLEQMMQQLMSKEVLYEPLKELRDKFPGYLAENSASLSIQDKERYDAQLACVTNIVAAFEDPSYTDKNPEKCAHIVTLMNEMQSHGSPPAQIMGDLPPGFDLGPDGMPNMPEGCVVS